jgi:hypothetical protein
MKPQRRFRRAVVLPSIGGPRCVWCDGVCANPAWGNGRCSACHGEGRVLRDPYDPFDATRRCTRCDGTGKCPDCGGGGVLDSECDLVLRPYCADDAEAAEREIPALRDLDPEDQTVVVF